MEKKKPDKPRELDSSRVDSKAHPDALETGEKIENWAAKKDSEAYKAAEKLYKQVATAFKNQDEQSDRIQEYWDIYNANPDGNLQYTGNSNGYVPVVRDAVNARTKRTLKQLFPANHKHVNAISSDGKPPYTQLSLIEHYIRKTGLKSIVRSDLIAGDVTGQWNLMVDWHKSRRNVTKLVKRNPIVQQIEGEDVAELEIPDPSEEEYEDTETEEVVEQGPDIVDFATEDLAVIPPTCMKLERAKAVAIRLRLSAETVKEWVDEGTLILPKDTDIEDFCKGTYGDVEKRNRDKKQTEDAGIKTQGTLKYALIFMVYTQLDLDDGKESALIYYAGKNEIVGILRNPLWSGKIPILSAPVNRVQGSFFGKSVIEPVKFMQWDACDTWNMGQDSKMYSMLPIFFVDPIKTPQWASLVMGLAAIWPVAPGDVKQAQFAQLWKDSMANVDAIKRQIWESLDVNEMMMGKMPAGRKNNQLMGQMAQEQMTSITDHAERYEDEILTPLAEMLFEFDQQFRDAEVEIESRGEIGVKAKIETVPVQQWGEKLFFSWSGTAYQKSVQMLQQQIAWANVMKGIPPQMMGGKRLDLSPILEAGTENIFGPDLAPRILVDDRNMLTIDPDTENEILNNGMMVGVHEADNDQQHLQAHMKLANLTHDPQGLFKAHMAEHMKSMQTKRERAMAQSQPKGAPGTPGGAAPGAAGAPRPGAQPGQPRGGQQPPGAVQTDNMAGAGGRG